MKLKKPKIIDSAWIKKKKANAILMTIEEKKKINESLLFDKDKNTFKKEDQFVIY